MVKSNDLGKRRKKINLEESDEPCDIYGFLYS